jgi:hypothetical protein
VIAWLSSSEEAEERAITRHWLSRSQFTSISYLAEPDQHSTISPFQQVCKLFCSGFLAAFGVEFSNKTLDIIRLAIAFLVVLICAKVTTINRGHAAAALHVCSSYLALFAALSTTYAPTRLCLYLVTLCTVLPRSPCCMLMLCIMLAHMEATCNWILRKCRHRSQRDGNDAKGPFLSIRSRVLFIDCFQDYRRPARWNGTNPYLMRDVDLMWIRRFGTAKYHGFIHFAQWFCLTRLNRDFHFGIKTLGTGNHVFNSQLGKAFNIVLHCEPSLWFSHFQSKLVGQWIEFIQRHTFRRETGD